MRNAREPGDIPMLWWAGLIGSVGFAAYAFTAALQAAVLHVGGTAERAFVIWVAMLVLSFGTFALCARRLWKHYRLFS